MKKIALTTVIAAVVMSATIAAYCKFTGNTISGLIGNNSTETEISNKNTAGSKSKVSESNTTNTTVSSEGSLVETSELFSKRDLDQTPDLDEAKTINVSNNNTYEISEEGTYVFTGTATNYTIKVDADSKAKIQLVLDDVNITNDNFPVIYVVSADKCFITTTDSENTLTVTGQFTTDDDTKTDAVIYSKDDIVLNGTGTLNITSSYGNGISGKDDVKVTGGTYNLKTAKDSIEANDSICVYDGVFNITTSKDAFHSENDDDNTKGWICIEGGTFNITADSDGIQATTYAQIDGGNFTIKAREGIEATYVLINDGEISIDASDDGINASPKSTLYSTPTVEINGGSITIVMGQGDTDAIDANGNIYVNCGRIDVTATMSSFDYDGVAEFNGGTIIINGSEVDSIPESMFGAPGQGGGPGGFPGGGNFPGGDGNFPSDGNFPGSDGNFPNDGNFKKDGNFPKDGKTINEENN